MNLYNKTTNALTNWLTKESPPAEMPFYDYNRLKYEIRPGDVLLIAGTSRVSNIIRSLTQSPWTHAALYIGRLHDIEDNHLRREVAIHMKKRENIRLVIEGLLGQGTVVSPLNTYRDNHIRICRPIGLSPSDAQLVIEYAIKSLGQPYNMRQLLDLARFLLPWGVLPRRWGSSLFKTPTGEPESGICSSLIAEAFTSVQFPILPHVIPNKETGVEFIQRNPHLFTPKDFDYSPYFEIIKYPIFNPGDQKPYYRRMPWAGAGVLHQDDGILSKPTVEEKKSNKPTSSDEETT